jgi:hypothetical protein
MNEQVYWANWIAQQFQKSQQKTISEEEYNFRLALQQATQEFYEDLKGVLSQGK